MDLYQTQPLLYCGIDLHAKEMYACAEARALKSPLNWTLNSSTSDRDQLRRLELYLERSAKIDDPQAFLRLQTIPGVGKKSST